MLTPANFSMLAAGVAVLAVTASAAHNEPLDGRRLLSLDADSPSMAPAMTPMGAMSDGECSGTGANPGRYNFQIGDYHAEVLADQQVTFPPSEVYLTDPNITMRALEYAYLPTDVVTLSKNILYLEKDGDHILFDTGNGNFMGFPGALMTELNAMGLTGDDITKIMLTHAHFDHIGGMVTDAENPTEKVFPNAEVYISQLEYDYWTNDTVDPLDNMWPPGLFPAQVDFAKAVLSLYEDQLTFFELNGDVLPGISNRNAPWHTPGLAAYILNFDGMERPFVYTGDALNHIQLSIENPWFVHVFDQRPGMGPGGRYALLADMAEQRAMLCVPHARFPGLGAVAVTSGTAFRWHGVPYVPQAGVETVCSGSM